MRDAITPLTWYEIMGLDRGSTTHDIQTRYEKLMEVYSVENSMVKSLYTAEQLYLYRALIEAVYRELINDESRKEYDMNMNDRLSDLVSSLPSTFKPSVELKRFITSKNEEPIEKKDVFGRRSVGADQKGAEVEKSVIETMLRDVENAPITGAVLRELREGLGLTVDNMGFRTKISNYMLRAIEQGRHGELPADIYIRGFIRNYCDALKINRKRSRVLVDRYMEHLRETRRTNGADKRRETDT